MSEPLPVSGPDAQAASTSAVRRHTFDTIFTASVSAIFVDLLLLATAAAAIYSLASWLHFQRFGLGMTAALIGLPSLYLCVKVFRMALEGELDQ